MIFRIKDFTTYSFVYALCVLLSTPALIYLTTISWSKGVDTLLHVSHPDDFELPSFTICGDFRFLIDFQKIIANETLFKLMNQYFKKKNLTEAEYIDFEAEDIISFFGKYLTIGDILLYAKDLNKVLESISVYGVSNLPEEDKHLDSEKIGEKYCPKIIALKNSFLCIVITCQINDQRLIISDEGTLKNHVKKGVMLRLKFIHNEIKDLNYLLMGFHSEYLLVGYEDRLSEIKLERKPQLYQFQVRTYNNILLPPPSYTNCKNYTIEDDGTLYQKYALSCCLFDRLAKLGMVYFPNAINISWIVEHNYTLSLDNRPQYNGLSYLNESIESKDASIIYNECNAQFDEPDCLEVIYLIYYLTPIDLDSTVFYDDGSFRFDREFFHMIDDLNEYELNETELISHDERKYLYSVFQLLESSYPLMTNKFVEAMELKEYILLMASVYGTFTAFRVSQCIKRIILWVYSGFIIDKNVDNNVDYNEDYDLDYNVDNVDYNVDYRVGDHMHR